VPGDGGDRGFNGLIGVLVEFLGVTLLMLLVLFFLPAADFVIAACAAPSPCLASIPWRLFSPGPSN
jgi:hypothetical protein